MTASRKVLLAVLIVATGYGLAALCGAPTKAIVLSWQLGISGRDAPTSAAPDPMQARDGALAPGKWALESARLIPDPIPPPLPERTQPDRPITPAEPGPNSSSSVLTEIAPPVAVDGSTTASLTRSAVREPPRPSARFRDEAPRPLVEPQSPVMVKSLAPLRPAAQVEGSDLVWDPGRSAKGTELVSEPSRSADGMTTAQYAGAPPAAATSAHYQSPFATTPGRQAITPGPFSPPETTSEPRRHIIIDGDSLARLAGRYLDDPYRGEEIFEYNRQFLSDPELLPIGVEIVIPPRDGQASRNGASPQSRLPSNGAIHAAVRGLVPVRPIPSSAGLAPRAQLSRPLPVE